MRVPAGTGSGARSEDSVSSNTIAVSCLSVVAALAKMTFAANFLSLLLPWRAQQLYSIPCAISASCDYWRDLSALPIQAHMNRRQSRQNPPTASNALFIAFSMHHTALLVMRACSLDQPLSRSLVLNSETLVPASQSHVILNG